MRDASVFQYARVEPFADQSKQHPVSHPTLEQFSQMSVVDRIEEFSDIDLHDPAASRRHRLLPEAFQGLMRRPSRSEAVRTVLEVLLVDRFQDHDYRTLKHFILEGR